MGLAVDAIRLSSGLDVIVIISGDGDFIPLVEHLKGLGKQVEVMAFGKTTSSRLKEIADEFIDFDNKIDYYLLQSLGQSFSKRYPKL